MADILQNQGVLLQALQILGVRAVGTNLELGLFVGSAAAWSTWAVDLGALTECTAPGYARFTLSPSSWSIGVAGGIVTATYPPVTFTMTGSGGGQVVYGHFMYDSVFGHVVWGQNWTTPWAIPSSGGVAVVTPSWSNKNC